jgi:PAS domain S-box-containing protein
MISGTIRFRIILVFVLIAITTGVGLTLILWQTPKSEPSTSASQEVVRQDSSDSTRLEKTDHSIYADNNAGPVANIRWIAAGTTGIVIAIVILGAIWIIHLFNLSLRIPQSMINELVQGNTKVEIPAIQNEFSPIVNSISQLSNNIQRSSEFAENIGEGNFQFDFMPASTHDTLGNSLLQMREKLKNIAEEDKVRNWSATGLAMFADLIRKGGDQKTLSDALISHLVKHTRSNQGGLYTHVVDDAHNSHLELIACYAYDRKKHIEKSVDIGNGLLGQCFLERSPVYLKQVPNDYVSITSGLGMSNPTSLLIVPLKLNDSVEGVVELASFSQYHQYEIEFVERVGEMIASAITSARVTDQTKRMLEESQQQSEEMRAQEEEMRQNMEEMQATQEAMERQANELKKMQKSLEVEKSMFAALMDALPDRITYKDTESRITRVNKAKALRLNMHPNDVIGKTDFDFFTAEHAEKAMQEEKSLLESGRPLTDHEELLTFNDGATAWVSSSRIPFTNEHGVMTGMFIISKDITKLKHAQLQLIEKNNILETISNEFPVIQLIIDKDDRIADVVTGTIKNSDLIMDALKGKIIHEVLPNLAQNLRKESEMAHIVDTLPNGPRLKQFAFADKVNTGGYTVVAIVAE